MLVFGRRIPPRTLIVMFMVIACAGNALSAMAVNAPMLVGARFLAGLPHGAFFGTATLVAKLLARKGKEARAVASMVTGQTVANMLGVPAGTLLAEHMSWRLAFVALAVCAAVTARARARMDPSCGAVRGAGLRGQFRFLRQPGPGWCSSLFSLGHRYFLLVELCEPWLQKVGGWPNNTISALMMLAGFGMGRGRS